jgi:tricorn protease
MYPDISSDFIVFVNDDDLWKCNLDGTEITRLTYNIGVVTNPFISPDRKFVYFRVMTGNGVDSSDIYRIAIDSGNLERMTYLNGKSTSRRMFTFIAGFHGNNPVISTDAYYPFSSPMLYELDGFNLLPLNYGPAMNIIYNGDNIILGRNTIDMPHWKRYKGGTRGKILSGINNNFKIVIDLDSNVNSPMLIDGRIYFISDHEGTANIYSTEMDGSKIRKETDFSEYNVRNAKSDGKNIIFQMAGDLYLLTKSGVNKISIDITAPEIKKLDVPKDIENYITSYNISNDGKNFMLISRGQLFETGIKNGYINNIKKLKNYLSVFGNDSIISYIYNEEENKIAFFDFNGNKSREFNFDYGIITSMKISPDNRMLALGNNRFQLFLLNIDDLKLEKIDESESDSINDFSWSSDSLLLVYSYPETKYFLSSNGSSSIKIYDTRDKSRHQASTPGYIDFSPVFSLDNSYIYYLSKRYFDPIVDELVFDLGYQKITKPFAIPVKSGVPPLFSDINAGPSGDYSLENLPAKSNAFPCEARNYESIASIKNGVLLFYFNVEGNMKYYLFSNGTRSGKLIFFNIEKRKEEDYEDNVIDFKISNNNKYMAFRKDKSFLLKNLEDKTTDEIDIKRLKLTVNPENEFYNMLFDVFKLIQENYWDSKKVEKLGKMPYEKYKKLIPKIASRFELSDLIREMQGEYSTSHSYEIGGDITDVESINAGKLGIDYAYINNEYVIKKIYSADESNENEKSPLLFTDIKENDVILSINNTELGKSTSIDKALLNHANEIVNLKVKRNGIIKNYFVKTLNDEKFLRYRSWVEYNRNYVHEKTNNSIGYIHIPDMGMNGFNEFFRLYSRESKLGGLIVDLRFNGGGFVSQLLMEKLARKRIGYDIPRRGIITPYPQDSVDGPMVALTNEYAGSDGDIGTFVFKEYKLGDVIGTRTWGGVVGINPKIKLIDNTTVTQPQFATWFKGVKYGIENYGVDPDIYVENMPQDFLKNRDKQLDTAISNIMEKLKGYNKLNIK